MELWELGGYIALGYLFLQEQIKDIRHFAASLARCIGLSTPTRRWGLPPTLRARHAHHSCAHPHVEQLPRELPRTPPGRQVSTRPPDALVRADARSPALLASAPLALVLAKTALLSLAALALMLANARPALLAFAPDALVRADARPPRSLHWLLRRWCGQLPAPPHSLHWLLMRWCGQMRSSGAGAGRAPPPRTPCIGSSGAGADRCSPPSTSCICS